MTAEEEFEEWRSQCISKGAYLDRASAWEAWFHQQQKIDELERDALNFPTLAEFSNLQEDYEKAQQEIDSCNSIREVEKKILIEEIEKKLEEGINAALSHTLPYLAEKALRKLLKEPS